MCVMVNNGSDQILVTFDLEFWPWAVLVLLVFLQWWRQEAQGTVFFLPRQQAHDVICKLLYTAWFVLKIVLHRWCHFDIGLAVPGLESPTGLKALCTPSSLCQFFVPHFQTSLIDLTQMHTYTHFDNEWVYTDWKCILCDIHWVIKCDVVGVFCYQCWCEISQWSCLYKQQLFISNISSLHGSLRRNLSALFCFSTRIVSLLISLKYVTCFPLCDHKVWIIIIFHRQDMLRIVGLVEVVLVLWISLSAGVHTLQMSDGDTCRAQCPCRAG